MSFYACSSRTVWLVTRSASGRFLRCCLRTWRWCRRFSSIWRRRRRGSSLRRLEWYMRGRTRRWSSITHILRDWKRCLKRCRLMMRLAWRFSRISLIRSSRCVNCTSLRAIFKIWWIHLKSSTKNNQNSEKSKLRHSISQELILPLSSILMALKNFKNWINFS